MSITGQGIGIVATGQYAFKGAMASAPSASAYPLGTHAFFTDVGPNGTDMVVSSSGTWIPHNGRALLSRLTLPVVKAPTIPADASGTANGAITFGTAVNTAFTRCFCYFDANVVNATQPAGFYYMEMSSTTAAIVYNNTYTPANGVYPTEPTSKTAFSGAVPGGAGVTTEVTAFSYNINGGLLGLYGTLILEIYFEANTTAGIKSPRNKLGGTTTHQGSLQSTPMIHSLAALKNIGAQNRQRTNASFLNTTSGTSAITATIDTSVDTTGVFTLQTAAATDWCALSLFNVNFEVA